MLWGGGCPTRWMSSAGTWDVVELEELGRETAIRQGLWEALLGCCGVGGTLWGRDVVGLEAHAMD